MIPVFNQDSSDADKTPGETYDGSSDEDNNDGKIAKSGSKEEAKPTEEEKTAEK